MWLSDDYFFKKNIKLFKNHQKDEALILESLPFDFKHKAELFSTAQGLGFSWQGYSLNSRFRPQEEASSLVKATFAEGLPLVFGLGAGYHLPFLAQAYDFFWLVEPNLEIVRTVFTLFDLSSYFAGQKASFKFIFGAKLTEPPWPTFLVTHPPSLRLNPKTHQFWKNFITWPLNLRALKDLKEWPEIEKLLKEEKGPIDPHLIWEKSSKKSDLELVLALYLLLK